MPLLQRLRFNEKFSEILEQRELEAAQDVLVFDGADEKDHQTLRDRLRRLLHHRNRSLLCYMSKFHHMDLTSREPLDRHLSYKTKLVRYFRENFYPQDGMLVSLINWPNILLLVYSAYALLIFLVLWTQFAYDFTKIALNQYRSGSYDNRTRLQLERTFGGDNLEVELEEWIARLHKQLKLIGAPHLEWSITVENILTYTLACSFLLYILGPILYSLFDAIHFPSVRYALDTRGEIKHRAEQVRQELNELIELSRAYAESHLSLPLEQAYLDSTMVNHTKSKVGRPEPFEHLWTRTARIIDDSSLAKNPVFQRHLRTIQLLRSLAIKGRLRHLAHNQWIVDLNAIICVSFFVFLFTYCQACIVMLYLVVEHYHEARGRPAEFDSWRDLDTFIGSAFLLFIILTSATFYSSISTFNFTDQVMLVQKLKRNLARLLSENEASAWKLLRSLPITQNRAISSIRFQYDPRLRPFLINAQVKRRSIGHQELSGGQKLDPEDLFTLPQKMSADLLGFIVQFRLFSRDFRTVKRTFSALAIGNILVGGGLAIITRILLPYIDAELTTWALVLSSVGLVPAFLSMVPACYIHCRCLGMHRTLSALLAQLTRFETSPSLRDLLNYDFEISLLRKELAYPDRYSKHFGTNTFAGSVTYGNLLTMLFWMSLVLISLVVGKGDSVFSFLSRLAPGAL